MKKRACITAFALTLLSCGTVACGKTDGEISVYAPDGAPALAIAKLLVEDTVEDGVTYTVVDPSTVTTYVSYENANKNADICILPFTVASQRLGKNSGYQTLGIVTHGNLYLISKDTTPITSVAQLSGKTVGVLQLQSAPGQVFKSILQKNGEKNVTLAPISGGADVGGLSGMEYYLLAEPAVSAQKGKGYSIVGDIQALYGGENGFPQAVAVAKTSLIESRPQAIQAFVEGVKQSATWLQTATGETVVSAVKAHTLSGYETSLKAPLLTAEVLARCGVWFTQSKDGKGEMQTFLQSVMQVDDKITVIPDDGFYCMQDFNG